MSLDDQAPNMLPEARVGAALRLAREQAGISLREMAKRLNYSSHSMLSSYETGSVMASDAVVEGYERVLGLRGDLKKVLEQARVERHGDAWPKRRPHYPAAPDAPSAAAHDPADNSNRGSVLPRPVILATVLVGLAVVAVALLHPWGNAPESSASLEAAVPTPSPFIAFPSIQVRDGADPEDSGCARDPAVVLLDTIEVDYKGLPAGVAQLKYSPACGVSWPRFEAFTRSKIPTNAAIHTDIVRPDDDNVRSAFDAPFVGAPVFGNVLLSTSKCVYAAVWIEENGKKVPEVHTHCFRGSTYVR